MEPVNTGWERGKPRETMSFMTRLGFAQPLGQAKAEKKFQGATTVATGQSGLRCRILKV